MGSGTNQRSKVKSTERDPRERATRVRTERESGTPTRPPESIRLHATRSNEWIDAGEMRQWAIEHIAGREVRTVVADLAGADHLDASALQILLALRNELNRHGGVLQLENPSEAMTRWFQYAGAGELLTETRRSETGEETAACAEF